MTCDNCDTFTTAKKPPSIYTILIPLSGALFSDGIHITELPSAVVAASSGRREETTRLNPSRDSALNLATAQNVGIGSATKHLERFLPSMLFDSVALSYAYITFFFFQAAFTVCDFLRSPFLSPSLPKKSVNPFLSVTAF